MRKLNPRAWVGPGLIACVALATGVEVYDQASVYGLSSLAIVASLSVLVRSVTIAIAVYLVWRGWPRKLGRGLYCRRCGYHQEERGRITGECPECAAPWRWIGRFRTGERRGERWMVAVGLALLLVATGSWVIRRVAPGLILSWVPTEVLLQQIEAYPDDEVSEQWKELDRRKIPAPRLEELAQALIRKKSRDGYLSRMAEGTVQVWISHTPEPSPIIQQYFSQVIAAVMEAPDSVEVGQPLSTRTRSTFRGETIVAQPEPRIVIVSALYLNGEEEPTERWVWPVRATSDEQTRPMTHLFTPAEAGPMQVRQVFWLVMGDQTQGEVTMGVDGPIVPKGLAIRHRFELARTIEVKEPPRKGKPATAPDTIKR